MTDEYDSDEDKYANESFETESETENIPEHVNTESSSEDELPTNPIGKNSFAPRYSKGVNPKNGNNNGSGVYRHRRDYAAYHSSSDDDNDVIISETIAEINTAPMRLEDADILTPKPVEIQRHISETNSTSTAQSSVDESDEESDDEENEDYESDSNNENANSDTVIEQTAKTTAAESSSSCNEDSENEVNSDSEDNTSEANETDDINESDAKSECLNEYESDVLLTNAAAQEPIANDDDDYDDVGGGCKEVASQLTFTQSLSRTKCGINCDDCIETAEAEETEFEAISDTNLNDLNAYEPTVEMHLTSQTPTSFNSDDYTFHMNLIPHDVSSSKTRLKAAHRKSWSFTNERMREIERQNQILLKKILTQKPTYCLNPPKKSTSNNKFTATPSNNRITSAAVNRKKQQRQIDLDNQVLKRKIEAISLRRPLL